MRCLKLVVVGVCLWSVALLPVLAHASRASKADEALEKAWGDLHKSSCNNVTGAQKTIDAIEKNLEDMEKLKQQIPDHNAFKDVARDVDSCMTKMERIYRDMKGYKSDMQALCDVKRPQGLSQKEEVALINKYKADFDKAYANYTKYAKDYEPVFARYVQAVREFQRLMEQPLPLQ